MKKRGSKNNTKRCETRWSGRRMTWGVNLNPTPSSRVWGQTGLTNDSESELKVTWQGDVIRARLFKRVQNAAMPLEHFRR